MNWKMNKNILSLIGISISLILLYFVIEMLLEGAVKLVELIQISPNEFLTYHLFIGILFIATMGFDLWLIQTLIKTLERHFNKIKKVDEENK